MLYWGKRHRREVHDLNLLELEVVAPNWHESVARYRLKGGTEKLKKYDYTSYEDDIPYYTMIIMDGRRKIKILLDLNSEIAPCNEKNLPGQSLFCITVYTK